MGETIDAYRIFEGKLKGRENSEEIDLKEWVILKWFLIK
jgi:hypothetical protein